MEVKHDLVRAILLDFGVSEKMIQSLRLGKAS